MNYSYILRYNSSDLSTNGDNTKDKENPHNNCDINGIFKNLDDVTCRNDKFREYINKIDDMNDQDFDRIMKSIRQENAKLLTEIYFKKLLNNEKLNTDHLCKIDVDTLVLYKKMLEEKEDELIRENDILSKQLEILAVRRKGR
uniref:Oberon_cc domain-containing protein n=1 Tax=Parastrongyloides trichosuri TaxID=131310 RepID=A0A0N4ZWZ2_PARTI